MGVWGFGAFENDTAVHWVHDLEDAKDHTVLETAFLSVLNVSVAAEMDCCEALAAAEVVAALHKAPSESVPDEVTAWIKEHPTLTESLRDKSIQATEAMLSDSGLRNLWEEEDDLDVWKDELEDLIQRLK
ncbi:MAG: DUF4259 domain-containing protein [Candidatus Hydrogenedentota bacterium]